MHIKSNKITIQSYLDFAQLLKEYRGSHEENRTFALKHQSSFKTEASLLLRWASQHAFRVTDTKTSSQFFNHSNSFNNLLGFLSLLLGLLSGLGLLSYSGEEPINIIYYLFFVMFLPLGSMGLTLISMFTHKNIFSIFTLFFPLHWFEKILGNFSFKSKRDFIQSHFSFELQKWMFLYRLQLFSLLFSVGLLLALVFIVISQDIAFSWSTTLEVSTIEFYNFLNLIALPWSWITPSALPSLELVEISQHYRLGEVLNSNMINHAEKLGGWWKYLAMTTLFYAIILRVGLWFLTRFYCNKILRKDFFNLDGVAIVLREFKTPYVSTESIVEEKHLEVKVESKVQIKEKVEIDYEHIIAWNFSYDELILANDSKEIKGLHFHTVGGSHSFNEDEEITRSVNKIVLLYVKSWEPPTMDFIDFLELLIENNSVEKIEVFPLGTTAKYYESSTKELSIWKRKIEGLNAQKVWVIDAK